VLIIVKVVELIIITLLFSKEKVLNRKNSFNCDEGYI